MSFFDRPPSKEYFELNQRLTEIATTHRERDDGIASQVKELAESNAREHQANAERIDGLTTMVTTRFADTDAKLANIAALTATNLGKLDMKVENSVTAIKEEFAAQTTRMDNEYKKVRYVGTTLEAIKALFTDPKYRIVLIIVVAIVAAIFGGSAFKDLLSKL